MELLIVLAYIVIGILVAIWSASVDENCSFPPLFLVVLWLPVMVGFAAYCLNDYLLELGKRLRK